MNIFTAAEASRFCELVLNRPSAIEDTGKFLPVWTEVRQG